jgi:hypothetical protein
VSEGSQSQPDKRRLSVFANLVHVVADEAEADGPRMALDNPPEGHLTNLSGQKRERRQDRDGRTKVQQKHHRHR